MTLSNGGYFVARKMPHFLGEKGGANLVIKIVVRSCDLFVLYHVLVHYATDSIIELSYPNKS